MKKNSMRLHITTLYVVLWALITVTSVPTMAMDSEASSSMSVDSDHKTLASVIKKGTKRSISSSKRERYTKKPAAVCPICDKKISLKNNLRKHMLIHTDERPHACKECDKTFTEKFNLIRHIRIHTGEKPYACIECRQGFSQKNNLQRHLKGKTHMAKVASKSNNTPQEHTAHALSMPDLDLPVAPSYAETTADMQHRGPESERLPSSADDPNFIPLPKPIIKQEIVLPESLSLSLAMPDDAALPSLPEFNFDPLPLLHENEGNIP